MNQRVIVLVLFACANAAFATGDRGLVLHYDFAAMDGQRVFDQSGSGNDGEAHGQVAVMHGALKLDGKTGYVRCASSESLDIGGGAATIMFWFKPAGAGQGGLVSWTGGPGKPNQRLVTSLNVRNETRGDGSRLRKSLGLYISDGEHFDAPYRITRRKAYFPPADQWLFYTVTFDGKTLDIYRDAAHVEARFQTLSPKTADVPVLIGKCFGMGGQGDFFNGLIDEVRIYNRQLSPLEVYEIYQRDARGRGKTVEPITLKAASYPRPGMIHADVDYRGLLKPVDQVDLEVTLADGSGQSVAHGEIRMLPPWGRAQAVVDVSNLPAGSYQLRVGKSATANVNWPGRAKGWENVKVLNNFCWELLRVCVEDGIKARYVINNPTDRWIYVLTDGDAGATVELKNAKPISARTADIAGAQEHMRWMSKGEITLTVNGQDNLKSLIVRAVPTLAFHHYPHIGPGTGEDHEHLAKYVLGPYNTLLTHNYAPPSDKFRAHWANNLGRHVLEGVYPATHLEWNAKLKQGTARQQIWDYLTKYPGLNKDPWRGVIMDEFTAGDTHMVWNKSFYDEWIETCDRIQSDPKHTGRHLIPFFGYNMYDYDKSSQFLRMFIKHGSPLAEEIYVDMRTSEDRAWQYIYESGADVADDFEHAIPGYTQSVVKYLSYLHREYWNPAADFKVHLEMQVEQYATRPEFFGLGGLGAWSSYNCNNGEYVHWLARLCRHYGLEGHTKRLSNDPYELPHIRNPDFYEGADHWKLQPAEPDSIAVDRFRGYGRLQERDPHRAWTDMPFLRTRRSPNKPNVFSQPIRGLQPGRLYMVRLYTGDYGELKAGKSEDRPHAISLTVDGGEVWNGWYRPAAYDDQQDSDFTFAGFELPPFGYNNPFYFKIHQLIFRAQEATARLWISDWQSRSQPGGPAGQELMFNRIELHPYLEPVASPIGVKPQPGFFSSNRSTK